MRQKRVEKKSQMWRKLLAVVLAVAMLPFAYVQPVRAAVAGDDQSISEHVLALSEQNTDDPVTDLKAATIDTIGDQHYTGAAICPSVNVSVNGVLLQKDVDYTVFYDNNVNIGTAVVIITGTGSYSGMRAIPFQIIGTDLSNATVDSISTQRYTGDAICPGVTVKMGSVTLQQDTDYTLSYQNNIQPGTASITISGKGIYSGSKTVTFAIEQCDIAQATIDAIADQNYTGSEIRPGVYVRIGSRLLSENVDYTLKYENNTSIGTAKITVTGMGNYSGTKTASFQIVQFRIDQATIDTIADQSYSGYELRPTVRVHIGNTTLSESIDYTVRYDNNIYTGIATVTVTGTGKYANTGSKQTYFRIVAPNVTSAMVTTISDQTYTGSAICPSVTVYVSNVVLREGVDYTVSYYNNVNIGTATVTITGIGSYSGTRTTTFRITGPNLYSATIAAIPDQLYTGSYLQPTVTVTVNNITLRQGTDYIVSYSNNRNVGTATVTVTGRGSYNGTKTATFRILGKDVSNATVNSISTQRYTGEEIRPAVTVKIGSVTLQQNVDYTLSYRDNTRPGTASIIISGVGTCSGSKTVTFKIAQASLSRATVKVSDQTYDGEAQTPHVTVKLDGEELEEDLDFEVEYRNNKKPGKATAVITGIGDYSGTKKGYFVIKPKKVTWVSAKATTNSKGKAASLSWKKDSYASGYELHYSKKKASGYKCAGTLNKNTYTECTHNRRPSGTYYYKVRSYILVDGIKCYSAYSNVKKVKIK